MKKCVQVGAMRRWHGIATLRSPVELSVLMPMIVRVAVPVPLPRLFDYSLPEGLAPPAIGARVRVPFAGRQLTGIVCALPADGEVPVDQLKPLLEVLDPQPLLDEELRHCLDWAARYYQHPIGEVYEAAIPAWLRRERRLPGTGLAALALSAEGRAALELPPRRAGARTDQLLRLLVDGPVPVAELDERLAGWRSATRSLKARGWVHEVRIDTPAPSSSGASAPQLNAEQKAAVQVACAAAGQFMPFLLEGVTGSGKTEVYLAAIEACIAEGRQALVLVPEIALTPQLTQRFRARLGFDIAILHSGLAERERAQAWLAAARGQARVVLGTRSAVFVPLARPGLIVIDEEHDASFKQQDGFRYHARDLALVRARALKVPILLGSATPSLESLANVEAGRYRHLRLTRRAGAALPPSLTVMDLRGKRIESGLAVATLKAMAACLDRGEQVLVFRNRRGFAPVLMCHACGWSAQCQRCDRPMTVHRGAARLRCHHCGAESRLPEICPACSSTALAAQGAGTERIEATLRERFPAVPVLRVDRDSTSTRTGRESVFEAMHASGARILVGTQMLAKGHDLPNLTLVVIVGVDNGLFSVDFRAAERLGQLVVQVAGRAGRADRPGAVILQTHQPDHPLLQALLKGGYATLARDLLVERRAAGLPPFGAMALLRAEALESSQVQTFLDAAVAAAGAGAATVRLHGPMPAPMPRRAGYQRAQVLVEADTRAAMQAFLPGWLESLRGMREARRVRWSIDVDPVDLA